MDPQILRAGFRIGVFVSAVGLALVALEPRDSPEFVASVLALAVGLAFVTLVALLARYSTPRMPRAHNRPVQRTRREE